MVIPENYYQCKLRWSLTGDMEEMISTIGVVGNDPGPRDVIEVAHAVLSAWEGAFPSATSLLNVYTLLGCDVTEGSATGDGQVGTYEEHHAGGGTTAALPSNCALLVTKKTALGGRHNVGRMYLPAGYLGETSVNPIGELDASVWSAMKSNCDQFMENLKDSNTAVGQPIADFQPVIFHGEAGRTPTPITSLEPARRIATQRRRMRK